MQQGIISVRPNSVFTAFKYISEPCETYKLWQVVFKEKEVEFEGNPIGVVIQTWGDGELRADMYGVVSHSEIRPATYAEIKQYHPDLLPKLVRETYLTEIEEATAHELFPKYAIFYEKGREICQSSSEGLFPIADKYYLLKETHTQIVKPC
jgi:hypothetical protein